MILPVGTSRRASWRLGWGILRSSKGAGHDRGHRRVQGRHQKVEDKLFQARTQLTVALMLFDQDEYLKSAQEYEIYLNAYGDVAQRIGFDHYKVLFRIAQCPKNTGGRSAARTRLELPRRSKATTSS